MPKIIQNHYVLAVHDLLRSSRLDHNYFGYLRVDDVDGFFDQIKHRGIKILFPVTDKPWGMREFSVESPEGHRITIGQSIGARE